MTNPQFIDALQVFVFGILTGLTLSVPMKQMFEKRNKKAIEKSKDADAYAVASRGTSMRLHTEEELKRLADDLPLSE